MRHALSDKQGGGGSRRAYMGRMLLVVCALWMWRGVAQEEGDRVGRFRVPEINEEGVMTSLLTGSSARMSPGRPMEIENLRIYFYEEDGETVRIEVSSPRCEYDDRTGRATSEDAVRIEGPQFTIDGKRFVYEPGPERMEIFEDVNVVLRHDGGGIPGVEDEEMENP